MIDNEDVYWVRLRYQFEAELLFQSLQKRRPRFIRLEVDAGRQRAIELGRPLKDEIIGSGEPGVIQHWAVQVPNSS